MLNKFATGTFDNNAKNLKHIHVQISLRTNTVALNITHLTYFCGEYEETASISVTKPAIQKYTTEDIYFALTTSTKRIINTVHYIKFWAKLPGINCLIVLEQNDFDNNRNITEYLIHEGIPCNIQSSNIARYEERYLELFHLAWNYQEINKRKAIEWFAVGDDDTVWFINNLLRVLQQYNSSNTIYLGDISDNRDQVQHYGAYFAYGGGGIVLSRSLALIFSTYPEKCKQYLNIFGGDGMIGKCITEILKVGLVKNHNFHQMDHHGDMTGYLESGINGLVTLHHMFSYWRPFPKRHTNKINETMYLLQLAYATFDETFLKRYVRLHREANQTLLLTMGYSFTIFNRILLPAELNLVENTWDGTKMIARKTRSKENKKTTWYFRRSSTETSYKSTRYRTVYEKRSDSYGQISNIEVVFTN
ncbi:unnamed protein product [Adineta steineri]|uniref:Uncharacterized protein n=1 Tax=Adineta steineri TaxID=433720 RepID=A0A819U0F9_9BILA|nr:unnamed protein product [Adineta steineri]CAF4086810.1 unnamed protein product [Adineta steineri]